MLPKHTAQMVLLSASIVCCPEDCQPLVEPNENTASDPTALHLVLQSRFQVNLPSSKVNDVSKMFKVLEIPLRVGSNTVYELLRRRLFC